MCAAASPPFASWRTYTAMSSIEFVFLPGSSFAKAGSLRLPPPPPRASRLAAHGLAGRAAALALPGCPVPRCGEFGAGCVAVVEQLLFGRRGQVEVGGFHPGGVDEDGPVLNAWLIDIEAVMRAGQSAEQGQCQVDWASGGSQRWICAG